MPDNRGIQVRSTRGDIETMVSSGDGYGWQWNWSWSPHWMSNFRDSLEYMDAFDWLVITPTYMTDSASAPAKTPAEIIKCLFGSSLSTRESYGMAATGNAYAYAGQLVGPDADLVDISGLNTLNQWLAKSYIGSACLSYVPPQIESTTSGVVGFFDHTQSFGLSYEWSVLFSLIDEHTFSMVTDSTAFVTDGGGDFNPWQYAEEQGESTAAVHSGATEWFTVSGDLSSETMEYSYYPPIGGGESYGMPSTTSAYQRSTSADPSSVWFDQALGTLPRGHTYILEAVGMDYFDTVDFAGQGDAGEMLVSDELIRFGPNATDISYYIKPGEMGSRFELEWTPNSEYRTAMKIKYHTFDSASIDQGILTAQASSERADGKPAMGDTWTGSWQYENNMREDMIFVECEKVYELYEVSELPKRFINKVQKRRDIPDGAVSAFGYIPPDGSTFSTTMSSYGAAPGGEGYFADTMGSDATEGYDYGEDIITGYGAGIGPWSYTATGFTGAIPPGTEFTGMTAEDYRHVRGLDTGECVIATHAVSSGMFSTEDKANAVDWCTNKLHGKWWGETMRRGYRYLGRKHIANGTAELVYDEFKECIEWANGKRPFELRIALRYAFRVAQTFIVGLFVKEDE